MASALPDLSLLTKVFAQYKERTETTDCLKLTPFLKLIDACGLNQYKTTIEASVWAPLQDKAKKISYQKIATELIDNVAADVVAKKRKIKGKAPLDDPEVQKLANEIRAKIIAKAGSAAFTAPKVDSVTARLTDASGYTGSHKERFSTDGKGKGLEGRKDLVENSGYVGNYKGAGTYDKKH